MFAAAIPAAIAAAGSFFGQQSANNANRNIARETNSENLNIANNTNALNQQIAQQSNAFSALQAQKQMDFQERMSSTSWQRGVADMRRAGINPMLAFSQGGASSPSGSAASASQIAMQTGSPMITGASQNNAIGPAVSSAMDAIRLQADLKNLSATHDNIQSQTNLNNTHAVKVAADTNLSKAALNKAQTMSHMWDIPNRITKGISSHVTPQAAKVISNTSSKVGNFYSKYGRGSPTAVRTHALFDKYGVGLSY